MPLLYDFFSYLERRGASAVSGRSNLVKGRKRTNRIIDFRGNGNLFSGDIKHIGRLDALSGEQLIQGKRRWWENHVRNGLSNDFEFLWPRTCRWNVPTTELQHERCQSESIDSRRRIECRLVGKYSELSLSLWRKLFDEKRSEFLSTARATEILT